MKAVKRVLLAAVTLMPFAALAQAPAAEPKITFTPYGFVSANAFFDNRTFVTKDYPGQVARANTGGSFLISARYSRFGVRLAIKEDNWTGAELGGVFEIDFKGGFSPTYAGTPAAPTTPTSFSWYIPVPRMRLANMTATWKGGWGSFQFLAGQDYGLVNPLFAESLAWVADPVFWQAGNLWRRSPQARITYAGNWDMIGISLAGAILSNADATVPAAGATVNNNTDFGAGNASRFPDWEGRLGATLKLMPGTSIAAGVSYHYNKRRYFSLTPSQVDKTDKVFGADGDINATKYLEVKGEWYSAQAADDTYQSIISFGTLGSVQPVGGVLNPPVGPPPGLRPMRSHGFWVQGIIKPIEEVWFTVGYGKASGNPTDLNVVNAPDTTREKNSQFEAGAEVNAGKYWRFGVEWMQTKTWYHGTIANATPGTSAQLIRTANQWAASSILKF